jgi:3-dehydroquinate synthase
LNPDLLTVALGERSYDIFFGREIYPRFQEWICRFYPGVTVHVVTDRNVAAIYGEDIHKWLAGIPHDVLALPPGEEHKSFDAVREIYGFLARGDAGRDSLVVAFGGGVVGDLAGFAAATYLRGISCIQVPTTLLSQVDSSVGGKTGFNLPEGKNLVGAFHQPRAVFIDDAFLLTLDERNLRSGMAEVVKCALAGDAELWDRLLASGGRWKAFSGEEWRWVVRRAVAFKASVVERDEREASLRRILNLGHTIGHAMEKSDGYGRFLHGEAVAIGLAWEAVLGRKLGVTGEELVDRLVSLLIGMGFSLDDPGVALTSIASAIGMDKKRVLSDVVLPIIAAPGRCEFRRVPLAEIRQELPFLRAEIRERAAACERHPPVESAVRDASQASNVVMAGDEAYEIRPVEENHSHVAAPETEPAIERGSGPPPAPSLERESESPGAPSAPAFRTVTLADLYWSQGQHSTARRIVGEILREDPGNLRAQAWLAARAGEDPVEADLLRFLSTMAKEYGYDLS